MAGGELHAAGGHGQEAAASRQAWHNRHGNGQGGPTPPLLFWHADCCGLAACELCIEAMCAHSSKTGESCVDQAGHPLLSRGGSIDCHTGLPMQGGGYGHGVVTAAKAFLESGYAEIGTGTLNEALALRRSGVTAPVHLCYQPDIQSARAVAHAHDVQAGSC